ncbi:GyrI-like domain-containing protein [Leucobacter albus]|uniref:GyrI-like domain-containing protein n=1 Tax=Leucobacter albus TaxID=272210 RepID=A0ABW3TJL9_9MICO
MTSTTEKIDFKKSLDSYQAKRGVFRVVDVPELQYLMIDGHGDPNTSAEYQAALEALYPVAFKLKFASKKELGRDYVVPPLEGLWWAADMASFTEARDKSQWDWTMMIMVPEWIDEAMVADTIALVGERDAPARLADVRLERLAEGECVQTLHVGSYDDEGPVLQRLHEEFIPERGMQMRGKHHEIYLSDARRVVPERLRTVLRQSVARE